MGTLYLFFYYIHTILVAVCVVCCLLVCVVFFCMSCLYCICCLCSVLFIMFAFVVSLSELVVFVYVLPVPCCRVFVTDVFFIEAMLSVLGFVVIFFVVLSVMLVWLLFILPGYY